MTALEDAYDTYLKAASTIGGDERLHLLRQCLTDDFEMLSPFPYAVVGPEALSDQLGKVAAAMPDGTLTLRRTGPLDAHNGVFRVTFENLDDAGEVLSTGLHIVESRGSRISRIVVFTPADNPRS